MDMKQTFPLVLPRFLFGVVGGTVRIKEVCLLLFRCEIPNFAEIITIKNK